MSLKYKVKKGRPFKAYDGFICDKCGKDVDADDFVEEQEALFITDTGGYGSVWGDGTRWSISLCQDCWHRIISPFVKIHD